MSIERSVLRFLSAAVFLCIAVKLNAQVTEIDTSAYLPLFYSGSLEYNLTIASAMGYTTEIERLVKEGAEIDVENAEGATPLYFAIINGKTDAVKTLIRLGADVNKVSFRGETPLVLSILIKNINIAEALVRGGADINYQNKSLVTPIHYASAYGLYEFVDMLLYYDADIDIKDAEGTTPLMAAIWAGYPDIAGLLIRNGANMEARDNDGFTPFLIAAQNGDTLILNMLKKKGVDIYEKNVHNSDALALTIKSNHIPATEFLLRSGNGWAEEGKDVISPYNVAAEYRRKEIMELLNRENIPGTYKPHFDRMEITLSSKFNLKDYYYGLNLSFIEPLRNIGIKTGLDTKLWYTRVLVKSSDEIFYQYYDRSSLVYAGVYKDFQLTDNLFKGNFYFSASLAAGYSFGNKFKGTEIEPDSKFRILPSASIKWNKNAFTVFAGLEYFNSGFYRTGPVWMRTGCSFNFSFDSDRVPGKIIKWY
ncbi:MAG TPA: ankyrin repeat domain-containing protein [Bacteroidales bacterium]|nr:ankyrin repeat domain-containing protein [Bacteroidales bacterium]HOX74263.1 ankyrin repeat domain-containing protein [Bacteroidales bacterium]HQM69843.1 ankyrin repeat domain-containing protein [Bacteroidales bacterium]